jgi:hypothetical protein
MNNTTNNNFMISSYLIYHPKREKQIIGNLTVYHDKFGNNEDPYIWNDNFYIHIVISLK